MNQLQIIQTDAVVVGTGAAGYQAACCIRQDGRKSVCIVTEQIDWGTSRNVGSDKQTYYKLALGGAKADSIRQMAQDLFSGGSVDGDQALCEAALSAGCFLHLCELGVPFPATNMTGGSGVVAMTYVKESTPDGYTVGYLPCELAMVKAQGLTEIIEPSAFDMIYACNIQPAAITVSADSEWDSIEDLVAWCKEHPGELQVGTSGTGSVWHIAADAFAKAAGINVDKMRLISVIMSTWLGAVGILVYEQGFGFIQLYNGPFWMAMPAVAAILIGGASVNKASIGNVIIGTILYQGVVTMTPTVMSAAFQMDMSEVIRIVVSNGMILYALTRKTERGR